MESQYHQLKFKFIVKKQKYHKNNKGKVLTTTPRGHQLRNAGRKAPMFSLCLFLHNYANVEHLMRYQCRHHSFLSMGTKTGDAGTWKLIKKSINEKLLRRLCLFVCLSGTAAPPSPPTCPHPIPNLPHSLSHTAEDEWFHYSDTF